MSRRSPTRPPPSPLHRPREVTLTNEVELEAARERSARASYPPSDVYSLRDRLCDEPESSDRVTPLVPEPEEHRAGLQRLRSKVGSYDHVPFPLLDRKQQRGLSLDQRAGFLLSLMDGRLSVQEVIDVSNMSEADVLRVLYDLMSQGVIALR